MKTAVLIALGLAAFAGFVEETSAQLTSARNDADDDDDVAADPDDEDDDDTATARAGNDDDDQDSVEEIPDDFKMIKADNGGKLRVGLEFDDEAKEVMACMSYTGNGDWVAMGSGKAMSGAKMIMAIKDDDECKLEPYTASKTSGAKKSRTKFVDSWCKVNRNKVEGCAILKSDSKGFNGDDDQDFIYAWGEMDGTKISKHDTKGANKIALKATADTPGSGVSSDSATVAISTVVGVLAWMGVSML